MPSVFRLVMLFYRFIKNLITNKPLAVSLEITHKCNARCNHCHRTSKESRQRATPKEFGDIFKTLRSLVVQISGGEPLIRKDVNEIIKAIKQRDGTPYIIFVTNGSLLTKEKMAELVDIGVDTFSISLDYPDKRHDKFRRIKGLIGHITDLVNSLDNGLKEKVTFNTVVHRENYKELLPMAEFARALDVLINFSPYTWLRTDEKGYIIPRNEMQAFKEEIDKLLAFKKKFGTVRTSRHIFQNMVNFFTDHSLPNCRAGERFLVVNPDATLSPCGLIMASYNSQDELIENFTKKNSCTACNTCIRATTEKPFNSIIKDAIETI